MAADITQAVTTLPALGAAWSSLPSVQSASFILTATTIDMTSFEGGGGGGGPIRPTSGFLYPRREG